MAVVMNYRPFGSTGLQVSEIGLGCNTLGGGVFYKDDRATVQLLNLAFDRGINFFDTADSYGFGHTEEILGDTFKGRRDRILIATKGGMLPSSLGRFGKTLLPIVQPFRSLLQPWKGTLKHATKRRQNFSSSYIRQAVENSLRRLRTDYLDLYQLHSPPTAVLYQRDVFETLALLKQEGKIRFYGVSAHTIRDALFCLQIPDLSSLQVAFNLLDQEAANVLFDEAVKRGVALIAREPLARGLLTENLAVQTGHLLNTKEEEAAKVNAKALSFLVKENGRSLPQAALQFVLHFPQISAVIPGTRSVCHLEHNIGALKASSLSQQELEQIASIS